MALKHQFEGILKFEPNKVTDKKKVSFDSNIKVLNMYAWKFAYHEARKSNWMSIAADRYRFELRKQKLEAMLTKISFFSTNLK